MWLELPDRVYTLTSYRANSLLKAYEGKVECLELGSMLGSGQLPPQLSSGPCPPSALWTLGLMSSMANEAAGPKGPAADPFQVGCRALSTGPHPRTARPREEGRTPQASQKTTSHGASGNSPCDASSDGDSRRPG